MFCRETFDPWRATLMKRLRVWCDEVQATRGKQRLEVRVEPGFAPLLAWVLRGWAGTQLALALNAYFATGSAVGIFQATLHDLGQSWVHLITRAKDNDVAYFDWDEAQTQFHDKDQLDRMSIFRSPDLFEPANLMIYGEDKKVADGGMGSAAIVSDERTAAFKGVFRLRFDWCNPSQPRQVEFAEPRPRVKTVGNATP